MEHHIGDPGVVTDVQRSGPGAPAIRGPIEPSVPAAGPQRPLSSHIDDVGITRIEKDPLDVLGALESSVVFVTEPLSADAALEAARRVSEAHPRTIELWKPVDPRR